MTSPAAAGLPLEDVERVARALCVVGTRPGFAEKPAWERWTELAAAALAEMRPTAAVPDPRFRDQLVEAEAGCASCPHSRDRHAHDYAPGEAYCVADGCPCMNYRSASGQGATLAALAPVPPIANGGEER